jgi:hypothetical protein
VPFPILAKAANRNNHCSAYSSSCSVRQHRATCLPFAQQPGLQIVLKPNCWAREPDYCSVWHVVHLWAEVAHPTNQSWLQKGLSHQGSSIIVTMPRAPCFTEDSVAGAFFSGSGPPTLLLPFSSGRLQHESLGTQDFRLGGHTSRSLGVSTRIKSWLWEIKKAALTFPNHRYEVSMLLTLYPSTDHVDQCLWSYSAIQTTPTQIHLTSLAVLIRVSCRPPTS